MGADIGMRKTKLSDLVEELEASTLMELVRQVFSEEVTFELRPK